VTGRPDPADIEVMHHLLETSSPDGHAAPVSLVRAGAVV